MVACAALVIAGCGSDEIDSMSDLMRWSHRESLDENRVDDPDWFTERTQLPACGTVDYFQPDPDNCFKQAYERGEPAELVTRWALRNGDSFVTYWRVLEPGSYELFQRYRDPGVGSASDTELYEPMIHWSRAVCTSYSWPPGDQGLVPNDFAEDAPDDLCRVMQEETVEAERPPDVEHMRDSYLCAVEDGRPIQDC